MSTEAGRTPIPPRPTVPPRPGTPPDEPPPPPSARFPDVRPPVDDDWLLTAPRPKGRGTGVTAPGVTASRRAESRKAADGTGTDAADTGFDAEGPDQASRVADLLAPFDEAARRRGPAAPRRGDGSAAREGSTPAGVRVAGPAAPSPDATAGESTGSYSAAPARDSDAPPPPPASARLPDTPPAATGTLRVLDVDDLPGRTADEGEAVPVTAPQPADPPPPGPSAEDTAADDAPPRPGAGRPFVFLARPALDDDTAPRPRPLGARVRRRAVAAAACAVLGLGLIGGAVTGSWLTGESSATGSTRGAYAATGRLWHSLPVDRLFPPTLKGEGAGPGGADRSWSRVAVAPDSTCEAAFDPLLRKALAPAGCLRLLRATYTDATRSHVTTVGLLFTKADADGMRALRNRFTEEGLEQRPDLMPRTYPAKGTVAEGFGDAQRASWTVSVLPDAPVVAYAVSGFADGRTVTDPRSATDAMSGNTAAAPAQAGLGHEAKGIADRVERGLRKNIARAEET
ncbi:hypothetical protein [Streptomyces huasconensis]|uniref:hypothetical protein n=1 Tax=Streptomyces huasconensis TaxID=1854574 RepID=UPI0036FEB575